MTSLVFAHSVSTERGYLCVNTADKNQFIAAVLQALVHISDKARHIPGGWNFIRSIFTTISCQPMMTDRPGIPLITKLLQSGNFFPQFLENHYIYSNGHRNLKKWIVSFTVCCFDNTNLKNLMAKKETNKLFNK